MIDIHCHILPGVDDGPLVLETSLSMASIASEDGIDTIIATPHTDGIRVNHVSVAQAASRLNQELQVKKIELTVLPGYEIPYHLVSELAADHSLAGSKYILVEFPHDYVPRGALNTFFNLLAEGFQPIIAHPERNHDVLINPQLINEMTSNGVLVQLTAASIIGELGPDIQRCSQYLLTKEMVHFVATDSHSPRFREPSLSRAYNFVKKLIGEDKGRTIFYDNPQRILSTQTKSPEPLIN